MLWRLADRQERGADARALAAIALASALFAALLEACLVWLKRGYPLTETLGNNFSLIFGIPPVWEILALGLLIALAAAFVGRRRRAMRPVLAPAANGTSVVTAPLT